MRYNSLIDDKKKQRVRDAIAKGDPSLLWPKKKVEPEPIRKKHPKKLPDSNVRGRLNSELLKAARSRDVEKVKKLIDKGADIEARNEDGWTPLIIASNYGYSEIVRVLIENGADANMKDERSKETALMFAVFHNLIDIVEMLIVDGKADVNIGNMIGCTPLMSAAMGGYTHLAKMLIERGADVNARTLYGMTALGFAQRDNRYDTAEMLRSHGAVE